MSTTGRTDSFDLAPLGLAAGGGRTLDLAVAIEPFAFGEQRYRVLPELVPVRLDVARMTGDGWSLRLRFEVRLDGPCMRCLEVAAPVFAVDVREVDLPGEVDELDSSYVDGETLDLATWARDALGLALPAQILCRPDCAGLCPECGANRNADPGHAHEREPDPRWDALRELRLDA